ncbi:MAG: hypothetical protein EP348_01880 [Alphaproteobacteria bacterium]|nr:MAG: hypothetical protein EP348_01880 [Alphaproteobacteria bacterium]
MLGTIYGYRNETAKAFGLDVANEMDTNLVTVYQIVKSMNPGAGGKSRISLSADKRASIVILGAGVSGLLAADKLRDLGYENVRILEKTDRYCGSGVRK